MAQIKRLPNIPDCSKSMMEKLNIVNTCVNLGLPTTTVLVIEEDSKIYQYNHINYGNEQNNYPEYPECSPEMYKKVEARLCQWCAESRLPPDTPMLIMNSQGSICYCYCK